MDATKPILPPLPSAQAPSTAAPNPASAPMSHGPNAKEFFPINAAINRAQSGQAIRPATR